MGIRSDEINDAARLLGDALKGEWSYDDERYDGIRKKLRSVMDDMASEFVDHMQENLHDYLAGKVKDMAERSIEAVLRGNEQELRRWLNVDKGAYSGREYYSEINGPVIHGHLFETGAVALRKLIVEAHPDLLKDERIKDMEAQIAALVKDNTKKDAEIERLRERLRERL